LVNIPITWAGLKFSEVLGMGIKGFSPWGFSPHSFNDGEAIPLNPFGSRLSGFQLLFITLF